MSHKLTLSLLKVFQFLLACTAAFFVSLGAAKLALHLHDKNIDNCKQYTEELENE